MLSPRISSSMPEPKKLVIRDMTVFAETAQSRSEAAATILSDTSMLVTLRLSFSTTYMLSPLLLSRLKPDDEPCDTPTEFTLSIANILSVSVSAISRACSVVTSESTETVTIISEKSESGMNSVPIVSAHTMLSTSSSDTPAKTIHLCFSEKLSAWP